MTHDQFLLYPTYEHQSTDQLKESAREELRSILASPRPADEVTFAHWVEVQDVLELKEEERVDALYPHHIWTQDYAQKRLRWQPRSPLSLMLLRGVPAAPAGGPALPPRIWRMQVMGPARRTRAFGGSNAGSFRWGLSADGGGGQGLRGIGGT